MTVKHLQAQQRSREQAALSVHISSAMQAFKIEQVCSIEISLKLCNSNTASMSSSLCTKLIMLQF